MEKEGEAMEKRSGNFRVLGGILYDSSVVFDETKYEHAELNYEPVEDEVKEMVDLYAKVWREILKNKTFLKLTNREQDFAAGGVFHELLKNRRAERIYGLHEVRRI